ncbi:hypothetical protein Tco_0554008 [Tanacetum coccineum]
MKIEECSNRIIMYLDSKSYINIKDYKEEWNINVSSFEEPLQIPISSQVREDVVDSTTTYHPINSQELIFSPIVDTKSQDHEDFFVFSKEKEECLDSLEELLSYVEHDVEVTHIDLNPPQSPQVVINQVGEDDLIFKNEKEQEKVSSIKEDHHVVERFGVYELRHSLCHGKRKFQEVLNSMKLVNVANVQDGGVLEVLKNGKVAWTRRTHSYLGLDLNGKSVNETQYRGLIGLLIYLTASRPGIKFSTYLCARYQAKPKKSHLIVVKRIFRCNMDMKSTSGACQLLGGKLVSDYDIVYDKISSQNVAFIKPLLSSPHTNMRTTLKSFASLLRQTKPHGESGSLLFLERLRVKWCMTRISNKELVTPYEEPKRVLHSTRKLFKTTSGKYYPPSRTGRKIKANEVNTKVEWDPTNIEFRNWLASKFCNYKIMDRHTKNALWNYWIKGDDEENIKMIGFMSGTMEYHRHAEWPTCNWKEDGYCNTGDFPGLIREGNSICYLEYEWYDALEDSDLKNEVLINKTIMEKSMNEEEELGDDAWSHYSPIDEWKDYKPTTYIENDISSNKNT